MTIRIKVTKISIIINENHKESNTKSIQCMVKLNAEASEKEHISCATINMMNLTKWC